MENPGNAFSFDPRDLLTNPVLISSVVNLSDNGIAILDIQGTSIGTQNQLVISFANEAFRKIFTTDAVPGSNFMELAANLGLSEWVGRCLEALDEADAFSDEVTCQIEASARKLQMVAGRVGHNQLMVVIKDLGLELERRKRQILSQDSEQAANLGTWEYDTELDSMAWSPGLYQIFGLEPNTPVSVEKYLDYANPQEESIVEQFINRIKTEENTFEDKLSFKINGQNKVLHIRSTPIKDEGGKVKKVVGVDVDVTGKVASEKELREQHHFIQQICEASPVLIAIFDLGKQAYTWLSKNVYPFVGFSSDQLLQLHGEALYSVLEHDDRQRVISFYNDFEGVEDGDLRQAEYRVKAADGSYRWLRVRGKVFKRHADGGVSEMICAIQDYTETIKAEEQLKENELMQLLLLRKDEFISVAAHELRTPITSIKASLQILKRLIDPVEKEGMLSVFLTKSISQVNRLTSLANDLLDITKIHAGKISLHFSVFSVESFFADILDENYEGFEIIVSNSVSRHLRADRSRLEQVFRNFLSNAAKYSPQASKILVGAEENNGWIKISVTDFGIGIPKEKLPYVFDRYYRVNEVAGRYSGLGLGLYICGEIVKMHGGEYGAESVEGQGSTFWFSIPVYEAEDEDRLSDRE